MIFTKILFKTARATSNNDQNVPVTDNSASPSDISVTSQIAKRTYFGEYAFNSTF